MLLLVVPVVYPLPPCDHVAFAYAVYDDDDDEPAAVVSVAGGKVIEEFESIGMVYDVQLFHRMRLHCSRRTQPSSLWKAMRRSR
jgi:hypothetical protein